MVGVKLQVIKIFPEREDTAGIFSSMDVRKEISNQTNARKHRHSTQCRPSVSL